MRKFWFAYCSRWSSFRAGSGPRRDVRDSDLAQTDKLSKKIGVISMAASIGRPFSISSPWWSGRDREQDLELLQHVDTPTDAFDTCGSTC
jgi:hypothetical protein